MRLHHLITIVLLTFALGSIAGCKQLEPEASHSEAPESGMDILSNGGTEAGGAAPVHHEESDDDSSHDTGKTSSETISIQKLPYIEVRIPVYNRNSLYGKLYDPWQQPEPEESEDEEDIMDESDDEEEARPVFKYPLVVLLHSLNGSHRDWGTLPVKLVQAGYAVLAIDMRGHQRSALRGRGWRNFTQADWPKLVSDLALLLNYFPNLDEYPQVDKTRTVFIGSSLGANAALLAAAKNEKEVKAVVALSPGIDYKGLNTVKAVYRYQNPILMVASQNDLSSFESTQILYRIVRGPKDLQLYRNIGHGTDMIRFYPALQDKVVKWLEKTVPASEQLIEYPPEEEDDEE